MAELNEEKLKAVAAAFHCAIWFLQVGNGEEPSTPSPRLDDAPDWAVESTQATVRTVLNGATPEQVWQDWAAPKRNAGWTWGPVKDQENKTHPCLVDRYDQLPERERFKDRVCLGLVKLALEGKY